MNADQGKARKLCRLLEDSLDAALGSDDQSKRTHAGATLKIIEALLEGLKP